jgi:hypothetical protein
MANFKPKMKIDASSLNRYLNGNHCDGADLDDLSRNLLEQVLLLRSEHGLQCLVLSDVAPQLPEPEKAVPRQVEPANSVVSHVTSEKAAVSVWRRLCCVRVTRGSCDIPLGTGGLTASGHEISLRTFFAGLCVGLCLREFYLVAP